MLILVTSGHAQLDAAVTYPETLNLTALAAGCALFCAQQ